MDQSFFRDHSLCTKFLNEISEFRKIIQGFGIGLASCVFTASDLHAAMPGKSVENYAGDAYLIILASNADSLLNKLTHYCMAWQDVRRQHGMQFFEP